MAHFDKVIVTNESALRSKYGTAVAKVNKAIRTLISADKQRGLKTKLVAIDDAATMKALGGSAVTRSGDPKQCKRAIDAVYAALAPDYLLILGSIDVVPHQDLINPVFGVGEDQDEDPEAFGDLPYACNAPYSTEPERFTGPTRVVGRLPDLNGAKEPDYLIDVLLVAASAQSKPASEYAAHLGISAEVWQDSTALSLDKLFGPAATVELSPEAGPKWSPSKLSARSHFINCHGSPADTHFYGQRGRKFPEAHDAAWLSGRIAEGTVLAAECCYGAELYDPALTGGQPGICNTYLGSGAYGVFGSSTIAYGPAVGNGSADLICQFFLKRVLEGASLGRAALEARQDFVRSAATLDPFDLKTLAQFSLMGDPSIQPVKTQRGYETIQNAVSKSSRGAKAKPGSTKALPVTATDKSARALRRNRLARAGEAIGKAAVHIASRSPKASSPAIRRLLRQEAKKNGIKAEGFASFTVTGPKLATLSKRKSARPAKIDAKRSVHMTIGSSAPSKDGVKNLVAIVVTEWDGQRVTRKLHSR